MSAPGNDTDKKTEALPQSNGDSNWAISVSEIKTVKVSNISLVATEIDMKEFFSFTGNVQYVEMRRESEATQLAYITFKESQEADTALLLSGATIADRSVTITLVEDYHLPPEALSSISAPTEDSAVKKAEDVVSSMFAKGFVLGKDALSRAKSFDERIRLTSNASATVASLDRRMGLSQKFSVGSAVVNEKVREMNERYQLSERTRSAFSAAEQKASSAGSAILSNPYVLTGASWVSGAFNAVAKAAGDVTTMTKVKVEKAQFENQGTPPREMPVTVDNLANTQRVESPARGQSPILPVSSPKASFGKI
ncbi:hypothetical protein Tsubulata_047144 [Turnera subulata]|uniref:RRM domain-containing protein n=1 Tax=Turnera subulata TaxID=218843 RepID=A0A9Q0JDN2_9ROSI|nr:hypothetical protein Tsubulata_047144 [Turnera subulata]